MSLRRYRVRIILREDLHNPTEKIMAFHELDALLGQHKAPAEAFGNVNAPGRFTTPEGVHIRWSPEWTS